MVACVHTVAHSWGRCLFPFYSIYHTSLPYLGQLGQALFLNESPMPSGTSELRCKQLVLNMNRSKFVDDAKCTEFPTYLQFSIGTPLRIFHWAYLQYMKDTGLKSWTLGHNATWYTTTTTGIPGVPFIYLYGKWMYHQSMIQERKKYFSKAFKDTLFISSVTFFFFYCLYKSTFFHIITILRVGLLQHYYNKMIMLS